VVGTNVYRLRVMKVPKWSQDRLAEAAGVAINTVALIEQARDPAKPQSMIRLDTLERLASALGVAPADLLREDGATRAMLHAFLPPSARSTDGRKHVNPPARAA
jgi:transcriptional regulator with XRE-family HTH domain